jgi:hypothetical protein
VPHELTWPMEKEYLLETYYTVNKVIERN